MTGGHLPTRRPGVADPEEQPVPLNPEVAAPRGSRYRLTLLPRPDLPVAPRPGADRTRLLTASDRYRRAALAGDAACAVLACLLVDLLRFGQAQPVTYWVITGSLPLVWLGLLAARGAYRSPGMADAAAEREAVFVAGAALVGLAATAAYLLAAPLSRAYLLAGAASAAVGSLVVRRVLRGRLHRSRRRGRDLARVLVVGHPASAGALVEALAAAPERGLVAVAACLPSDGTRVSPPDGIPLAADVTEVLAQADDLGVDAVALASDLDVSGLATRLLADGVAARGLDLLVATSTLAAGWVPAGQPLAGLPLLRVALPPAGAGDRGGLLARLAAAQQGAAAAGVARRVRMARRTRDPESDRAAA